MCPEKDLKPHSVLSPPTLYPMTREINFNQIQPVGF